jgi:hypothetical protein
MKVMSTALPTLDARRVPFNSGVRARSLVLPKSNLLASLLLLRLNPNIRQLDELGVRFAFEYSIVRFHGRKT